MRSAMARVDITGRGGRVFTGQSVVHANPLRLASVVRAFDGATGTELWSRYPPGHRRSSAALRCRDQRTRPCSIANSAAAARVEPPVLP